MGVQSENSLLQAYRLIEVCNTIEAEGLLNSVYPLDLDNHDLVSAILWCRFWNPVWNQLGGKSYFEQGEYLLNHWKQFMMLVAREENPLERTLYAFKKGVFSLALDVFSKAEDEKDVRMKSDILRKQGLCYKKLGSYEIALKLLTESNSVLNGQASVLAEMADCFALCGETKNAKMLFREAFYIDPEEIDLSFLDSSLIRVLIKKVEEDGYSGAQLQNWIPVYGILHGIFNVKRPLRSQEVLRLKQEIYSRECELKDPSNQTSLVTPRLLNLYFWLIDHFELSRESVACINEVMLKMKLLDMNIYNLYVK